MENAKTTLVVVGCATLVLAACGKPPSEPANLTDREIIAALEARAGEAASGAPRAARELRFVVRNVVGDQPIACGYASPPPVKGFDGGTMWGPVTVFVLQGRRLHLPQDMSAEEFLSLQRTLCGAGWVEPNPMAPPTVD